MSWNDQLSQRSKVEAAVVQSQSESDLSLVLFFKIEQLPIVILERCVNF